MISPERVVFEITAALRARWWELGLSHEEVAERAGIHRSTVSRVEAKKINGTLFVFQAMASALDISLAQILSGIEKWKS